MQYRQLSDLAAVMRGRVYIAGLPETRDIFDRYPNATNSGLHEVLARHFLEADCQCSAVPSQAQPGPPRHQATGSVVESTSDLHAATQIPQLDFYGGDSSLRFQVAVRQRLHPYRCRHFSDETISMTASRPQPLLLKKSQRGLARGKT
jgi:hypothetical protein